MAQLTSNTGETFTLLRSLPIYDTGTGLWSPYNWVSAGYALGAVTSDVAKGKMYFTLRSQINDSIPTITVNGVDVLAYQVNFYVDATLATQVGLLLRSTTAMKGIMFTYEIEFFKTSTPVRIEKGEFYFN